MNFIRTPPVQIVDECPNSTIASSFTRHTTAIDIVAQTVIVGSKTSLVVFGVL